MNTRAKKLTNAGLAQLAFSPLVVRVICLVCCLPLFVLHIDELWRFHHFRHLPFLVIGLAILLRRSWVGEPEEVFMSPWWDRVLLVVAGLCLAYGVTYWRPLWGAIAFTATCGSIIVWLREKGRLDRLIPILLFLVFFLRIPWQLDLKLLYTLQSFSASWASVLLDAVGVVHVRTGNIIWCKGRNFFLHEAYNGLPLFFSIMAISYWWQVFRRRSGIQSALVMCSSVFWVVAANVIWMVLVVYLVENHNFDLLNPPWHQMTRILVAACSVIMILCVDLALAHYPSRTRWVLWEPSDLERHKSDPSLLRTDYFGLGICVSFLFMLLVQCVSLYRQPVHFSGFRKLSLPVLEPRNLAELGDEWKFDSFESFSRSDSDMRGLREARWLFRKEQETTSVIIRYPFFRWHDAIGCQRVAGNRVSAIQLVDEDESSPGLLASELAMSDGLPAYSITTMVRQSGEIRQPVVPSLARSVTSNLRQALSMETASPFDATVYPAYEIQLVHVGASSASVEVRNKMPQLMDDVRELLGLAEDKSK